MAIITLSSTKKIPGVKFEVSTLAEAQSLLVSDNKGELVVVNAVAASDGGLYYITAAKTLLKICEVGAEVNP